MTASASRMLPVFSLAGLGRLLLQTTPFVKNDLKMIFFFNIINWENAATIWSFIDSFFFSHLNNRRSRQVDSLSRIYHWR